MMDPLVKEVRVRASAAEAFRRFTGEIGSWWPTAKHSVSEDGCLDVRFEAEVGGALREEAADGTTYVWGTVLAWEPPSRVAFTWHPGREADSAQTVDVTFESEGAETRVRLVHSGWEHMGEGGAEMRAGYDRGWEGVLDLYQGSFSSQ
jgi:uncharacterized protein YndB with AHSA1/START domain